MNVKLPISYSGNKFKIIDDLYKYFPNDIEILYEVFGGALTVGTNTDIKKIEYNDIKIYLKEILIGVLKTLNIFIKLNI